MAKIKTLYIVNHSHTDIGFTDFQDVVLRQHMEFIDRAIDLCEETGSYPKEAQAKWVCEVTGITERYLNSRPSRQVERFLNLYRAGRIDVAGMQYNLTPLLNIEQLHRTLYPIRRLRDQFGIEVRAAMNCDVTGASWILADLLPQVGIELFTMAVNPVRARAMKPRPSAFWWEGPAGGKVLAWNGYHYLFGGLIGLGDIRLAEKLIPKMINTLENDPGYPFDFVFGQTTNPIRVDNGAPDHRLSDFIVQWNETGRTPRIEWITVTEFSRILRTSYVGSLPVMRGDWTDWWVDGVASSSFETGLNRRTHELLLSAEFIGTWASALQRLALRPELYNDVYELATLYDEHTWGAFSSIEAPNGLFARSQWNCKAGYAYRAAAETHDILARSARALAEELGTQVDEVRFDLGHLPPDMAKPKSTYREVLVINSLPFERRVLVEEPVRRGGQAPNGMLEMFLDRGLTWGIAPDPDPIYVTGTVPGFGYSFIPLDRVPNGEDLKADGTILENEYYRVRVDPKTGGLCEWYDKELGHNFAGDYRGWYLGQYVYEWVDSPIGRDALFKVDWSKEDFGTPVHDTPFKYDGPTEIVVQKPTVTPGLASVSVSIRGRGIRSGVCTYTLRTHEKVLKVDWRLEKEHVAIPESVYFAFPFHLDHPQFCVDLNGVPLRPNEDQLPGAVRDWYPVQRWVSVDDGIRGVIMVPLDAPLVQLGGITLGKWARSLTPDSPTIMSWAMNNHWMVNFKASQGGTIGFSYALSTYSGQTNVSKCARIGAELTTPAIVLRDYLRFQHVPQSGQFLNVKPLDGILVTAKPADNGDGVIIRLQNLTEEARECTLEFPLLRPKSSCYVTPTEDNKESPRMDDSSIYCGIPGKSICSVRVRF